MTNKPIFLALLLLCLLLSPSLMAQAHAAPVKPSNVPTNYDGTPLFLPAEWQRMKAIQTHLEATWTLSVADMDYAAHLLRTPPSKDTPWLRHQRQMFVLAQLTSTRPKILTLAERRHLFDVANPYTNSPDVVVRANAMVLLASSRDPRAVEVLQRHAKIDVSAMNRQIASNMLRRLRQVLGKSSA